MLIEIDTGSTVPIYEQLRNQIVLGIASKQLAPGEPLPSVRRLAADLGINFHTVNKAYTMLCEEGYIVVDKRKGAFVSQPTQSAEDFQCSLSQKLRLFVAEAICHGITENEFVEFCTEHFNLAKEM